MASNSNTPSERPRRRGRGHDPAIGEAIRATVAEMLETRHLSQMSVTEVRELAGTTPPAFLRRYRSLGAVVIDIMGREFDTELNFDTGTLVGDLRLIQEEQAALFASPLIRHSASGLLVEFDCDPELYHQFLEVFLFPRRRATITILERAEARGEIQPGSDYDWVCSVITDPFVSALTMGQGAYRSDLVELTIELALRQLGVGTPA